MELSLRMLQSEAIGKWSPGRTSCRQLRRSDCLRGESLDAKCRLGVVLKFILTIVLAQGRCRELLLRLRNSGIFALFRTREAHTLSSYGRSGKYGRPLLYVMVLRMVGDGCHNVVADQLCYSPAMVCDVGGETSCVVR